MARRCRHYGSLVALNELPLINDSVNVLDVAVGAVVGLVASALIKAGLQKASPEMYAKIASMAGPALPALAGAGSAAALYFAQKGSAKSRATGHAAGAAVAGLVLSAQGVLAARRPFGLDFSDLVALNGPYALAHERMRLAAGMNGMIVNDRSDGSGMNGMIVNDNSDGSALPALAALSMGEDDSGDGGLAALAGMARG